MTRHRRPGGRLEAAPALAEIAARVDALRVCRGDLAVRQAAALARAFREARGQAVASYNHADEEHQVTEPAEDFATPFAASIQAKRFERVVKGGYEVRIGGQRAFCPISQVDTVRTAAPEAHQGQVYAFRIVEFKEGAGTVESAAELRDYAARPEVESSGAFGSLADRLRGALDSRRK